MNADYNDSAEEAGNLAKAAIPMASKLGLPINPHVYEICYLYKAQRNEKLCRAFDELLGREPRPSTLSVERLYQEYILDSDLSSMQILKDAVEVLMKSTEGALQSAQDSTQEYGDSLQNAAEELNDGEVAPDLLKGIVGKLLEDTATMKASTGQLQEQLAQAHEEVAQLQSEYARIREESLTDPLTGLKNRRAFDDAFVSLCADSHYKKAALSLLVIDIDHFKRVNDTFGHAVGDAVLKCIARITKTSVRGDDIAARFGGEELVVLLPETPLVGAKKVAEKIRRIIAAQQLKHSGQDLGQITVSIGVAERKEDEAQQQFFERADEALYAAKKEGRNRVCC